MQIQIIIPIGYKLENHDRLECFNKNKMKKKVMIKMYRWKKFLAVIYKQIY